MYTATRAALVIKCKMAGVGEEVETLGNTVVHSGEEETRQPLWNGLAVPQTIKHGATVRPSSSTPRCLSRRPENRDLHKHLYTKALSFTVQNNPSIHQQVMDKQNGVRPHCGLLHSHEKEWSSDTGDSMDEPQKHDAWWDYTDTEGHVLYDSIYTKCPEQADPWRQKIDEWVPGAGGGGWGEC